MDQIIIKGLRLFAYHGVNPEEKEQGQEFSKEISVSIVKCVAVDQFSFGAFPGGSIQKENL